jgi:hypothetical protein
MKTHRVGLAGSASTPPSPKLDDLPEHLQATIASFLSERKERCDEQQPNTNSVTALARLHCGAKCCSWWHQLVAHIA